MLINTLYKHERDTCISCLGPGSPISPCISPAGASSEVNENVYSQVIYIQHYCDTLGTPARSCFCLQMVLPVIIPHTFLSRSHDTSVYNA